MNLLRSMLFSLAAVLAYSTSASANTFYVAIGGSDSNPGSQAQPWSTIQHAVDTINPGDTIIVKAGTYSGCRIGRSGTSGAVCKLMAEAPGDVLINALSAANRHQSLIEIENFDVTTRYWVIDGFEVSGGRVSTGNWSLFTSRQYMKEHSGDIRIQSREGKGTIVCLTLPATF